MAFLDYIGYIGPGLKAFGRLFADIKEKKADDGKLSGDEIMECLGNFVEELLKVFAPIIRD